MKSLRCLALTCVFATSVSINVAGADTVTFTYTVSGDANANFVFPTLTYSFVPDADVATLLGPLDVRYQGTLDFSLTPPSGTTTATWDFGPLGFFSGTGIQFAAFPDAGGISQFNGTSVIAFGTGVFAGASGTTSYTGSADLVANTATFTERIEITAPGLTAVPEPSGLILLSTACASLMAREYRRSRKTSGRLSANR